MPFYDFVCKRGHTTMQRQAVGVKSIVGDCGHRSLRVFSIPNVLGGEVPFEETKYFVESAKKKAGWDYDHQMEHVQREKEKAHG